MSRLIAFVAVLSLGGMVGGCYVQERPFVTIESREPAPQPQHIPGSVEHQSCRVELARAMGEIDRLGRELNNCKRDREEDKRKHKEKVDELERKLKRAEERYEKLQELRD